MDRCSRCGNSRRPPMQPSEFFPGDQVRDLSRICTTTMYGHPDPRDCWHDATVLRRIGDGYLVRSHRGYVKKFHFDQLTTPQEVGG